MQYKENTTNQTVSFPSMESLWKTFNRMYEVVLRLKDELQKYTIYKRTSLSGKYEGAEALWIQLTMD